jgi:hypothetical protein
LRREAQEMSSRFGKLVSAAALVAEHHRRRRRRMGGAAAAACVMGLLVGAASWPWITRDSELVAPSSIVEAPHPIPDERPQDTPFAAPESAVAHQPPHDSRAALADEPVAFLVTEQNGRRVVAVGVYVPPRVEEVDLHDLSPLEQAAVRRVLGLEEEVVKPTI